MFGPSPEGIMMETLNVWSHYASSIRQALWMGHYVEAGRSIRINTHTLFISLICSLSHAHILLIACTHRHTQTHTQAYHPSTEDLLMENSGQRDQNGIKSVTTHFFLFHTPPLRHTLCHVLVPPGHRQALSRAT